jgi:polyphosphate kinase 2 (PPK2 family)
MNLSPPEDLIRRIERDLLDSYDEELELEIEDRHLPDGMDGTSTRHSDDEKAQRLAYFRELFRLQGELVKLQDWVAHSKETVVILF